MSKIPDVRGNYLEAVEMLQTQWPSDPSRPSPLRAQESGIDCLAILYRFLHASLSLKHWPPVEAEGSAILRYFWANLGHMEDDGGPDRDQLRQAALAQIQSTMGGADAGFAALCESPAMMKLVWARYEFCFYGAFWSRAEGTEVWTERPDLQTPTELAHSGRLDWDPESHPVLQEFVDQSKEIYSEMVNGKGTRVEYKCVMNEPLLVQIRLAVRQGVRVSLGDAHRFTAVTMRPGDSDPAVPGTTNVYAYDAARSYGYVLVAAVQTREPALGADSDTIRVFATDGEECVPMNTAATTGGESWPPSVSDPLPEGRTFLLFYRRVSQLVSGGLVDAAREANQRPMAALVDRKFAEDEEWFRAVSDAGAEQLSPVEAPAPGEGSSSNRPGGTPLTPKPGGSGPQERAAQQPAAPQAPTQGTSASRSKRGRRNKNKATGGGAQGQGQHGHDPPPQPPPPPAAPAARKGGPSGSRDRSIYDPSVPSQFSDINRTKQGKQRGSHGRH